MQSRPVAVRFLKVLVAFVLVFSSGLNAAGGEDALQEVELFQHKFTSKHFVFFSVLECKSARLYADYLEDFLKFVDANIAPVSPGWHLSIYLYPDAKILNSEGCFTTPRKKFEGRVDRERNAVFTFEECGIGILSHEVMHKIANESFKNVEPWAHEGIPTLFEMVYGYRSDSLPVLLYGYQNPSRLSELGDRLTKLTLKSIMEPGNAVDPFSESDKRLIATFLCFEGKLFKYINLAKSGSHPGYTTLLEAAFQADLETLEPRFKKYLAAINSSRKNIESLPKSHYFDSRGGFETFARVNRKSLTAGALPENVLKVVSDFH